MVSTLRRWCIGRVNLEAANPTPDPTRFLTHLPVPRNPIYGARSCWGEEGGGAALGSTTLCGSRMPSTFS
jgi:hypothetical protein